MPSDFQHFTPIVIHPNPGTILELTTVTQNRVEILQLKVWEPSVVLPYTGARKTWEGARSFYIHGSEGFRLEGSSIRRLGEIVVEPENDSESLLRFSQASKTSGPSVILAVSVNTQYPPMVSAFTMIEFVKHLSFNWGKLKLVQTYPIGIALKITGF